MPFEGVYDHLAGMIDEFSSLPERRIFDFHMHSGDAAATRDYLDAAGRYGVYRACDLTVDSNGAPPTGDDGFFVHCFWPRPDHETAGQVDWRAFHRRWVERFDEYVAAGARFLKLKTAPWPGRAPAVLPDDENLAPLLSLCAEAGLPLQIHAAQPDCWWPKVYDESICGAKSLYLRAVETMLARHPDLCCISVHMGSSPENPDYLDSMMRRYPNFHIDTSATKWTAREVSRRPDRWREFFLRWADRIFFGSDLVARADMPASYYASRFLVQRLMWESDYRGPSPIIDADGDGGADVPVDLRGLNLPEDVLDQIYRLNSEQLTGSES